MTIEDLKQAAVWDRAYLAGLRAGWNLGQQDAYKDFEISKAAIRRDLAEADAMLKERSK